MASVTFKTKLEKFGSQGKKPAGLTLKFRQRSPQK